MVTAPLFVEPVVKPSVLLSCNITPTIETMTPGYVESVHGALEDWSVSRTVAFKYLDQLHNRCMVRSLANRRRSNELIRQFCTV